MAGAARAALPHAARCDAIAVKLPTWEMRRVLNFYTSDSPRKGSVWFLVPGDTAVLCFSSWLSDLQGAGGGGDWD